MGQLVPLLILPLLAFWLWMFWDMTGNNDLPRWMYWDVTRYDSLPNRRLNWMLAFMFLNVFAAGIYYAVEYRNRP